MIRLSASWAAVLAVVAALGASAPAPAAPIHGQVPIHTVAAKTCSAGYTRGTINGEVKYLRAGEFCTHSADRQYRRYGFRCIRYYANVHRYRLTPHDHIATPRQPSALIAAD
jgi:hypothetical protein